MLNEALYITLRAILKEGGIEDAGYEAGLLLRHATGQERFALYEPTEAQCKAATEAARRRAGREPLQYLLGTWPFMGLELEVGPGVLIPRADTECVCEAALEAVKDIPAPAVLDLCSGTGALALGIAAARPDAAVTAVELHSAAHEYLVRNIHRFAQEHPNPPVPAQADALQYHCQLGPESLDLLVCNPPYVTAEEYAALQVELYHEPETALVAPDNGLAFYKAIPRGYYAALKPGAALVFEIGSGQGSAVTGLLEGAGYIGAQILQDLAGLDRVATARKPE